MDNRPDAQSSGKLTIKDFPHYKKKIVLSGLPPDVSNDEIFNFIDTYLNTMKKLMVTDEEQKITENCIFEDIQIVECSNRYAVIQINEKDNIEL